MNALMYFLFVGWIDYYLAATLLLCLVLCAGKLLRQPVERLALAWGTIVGLALLVPLCSLPETKWPRISIGPQAEFEVEPDPTTDEVAASAPDWSKFPTLENRPGAKSVIPEGTLFRDPPQLTAPATRSALAPEEFNVAETLADPDAAATSFSFEWVLLVLSGALLTCGLAVAAWQLLGVIQLRRLCASAAQAPQFAVAELQRIVGPSGKAPRLLASSRLTSAAACGLLRPTILLPLDLISQPPADEESATRLTALLSHEWAHVRRGDLWLLFLSRCVLTVLYAHPLYWLLLRRISVDREIVADSLAAQSCGRPQYAALLLDWARQQPSRSRPTAALGIWRRQAELSRRITMLVDQRISVRTACSRAVSYGASALIVLAVATLSLITIQPAPLAMASNADETAPLVVNAPAESEPAKVAIAPAPVAQQAPAPTQITIQGVCLDDKQQPLVGAQAMLFRIDAGTDRTFRPGQRIKLTESFIPGAQLSDAGSLMIDGYPRDLNSQRMLEMVRTDEAGHFAFTPQALDEAWKSGKSTVSVCMQSTGKGTLWRSAFPEQRPNGRAVDPLSFVMTKAATLRGRVTDSAGQPVAGALVIADEGDLPRPVPGILCAKTDADGRYEITDLTPIDLNTIPPVVTGGGTFQYVSIACLVDHPDFARHVIEYSKVPSVADAVLTKPVALTINVTTDEANQPRPGANISLTSDRGEMQNAHSDAQGQFVATRLEPGTYSVGASAHDRASARTTVEVKENGSTVALHLKRGGHIKGRLIDEATGKPVVTTPGAQVTVTAIVADGKPTDATQAGINQAGEFEMLARPGRNRIGLVTFGTTEGSAWELVDPDRWAKPSVEVAIDQTVEVELLVKANTRFVREMRDSYAKWRSGLMAKEPLSEESLRALIAEGERISAETEVIDGQEEIVGIECAPSEDELDRLGEIAPIERGLLAHIQKFPHLRSLYLFHPPGGDKSLESLRGLKHLEMLFVGDMLSDVTTAGVQHLATLPKLRSVTLISSKLDDDALPLFAKMPLESLTCGGAFTDAGVAKVATSKTIRALLIAPTGKAQMTDAALASLARMTKLSQLSLTEAMCIESQLADAPTPRHWAISDAGLQHLAALTELESLTLSGPELTDAGLVHLRGLKKLKSLDVNETKITPAGLDELRKHLPELKTTIAPPEDTPASGDK